MKMCGKIVLLEIVKFAKPTLQKFADKTLRMCVEFNYKERCIPYAKKI